MRLIGNTLKDNRRYRNSERFGCIHTPHLQAIRQLQIDRFILSKGVQYGVNGAILVVKPVRGIKGNIRKMYALFVHSSYQSCVSVKAPESIIAH